MELSEFYYQCRQIWVFLKKHQAKIYPIATIALFVFGTLMILFGIFFSKQSPAQAKSTSTSPSTASKKDSWQVEAQQASSDAQTIMVDVAGAVSHPGLYTLPKQSRLSQALEASGGFDSKVNKNFVAHSLNLAKKLVDEEKIYIPFQNEKVETSVMKMGTASSSTPNPDSKINVNTASQIELESLTGVGTVRAQNIISGRPFKTLQELVQKGILTQKIFSDNEKKLAL